MRAIRRIDGRRRDVEAELAESAYFLKKKRMRDAGIAAEKVTQASAALCWLALSRIHLLVDPLRWTVTSLCLLQKHRMQEVSPTFGE
jgi:hypothetical protein